MPSVTDAARQQGERPPLTRAAFYGWLALMWQLRQAELAAQTAKQEPTCPTSPAAK